MLNLQVALNIDKWIPSLFFSAALAAVAVIVMNAPIAVVVFFVTIPILKAVEIVCAPPRNFFRKMAFRIKKKKAEKRKWKADYWALNNELSVAHKCFLYPLWIAYGQFKRVKFYVGLDRLSSEHHEVLTELEEYGMCGQLSRNFPDRGPTYVLNAYYASLINSIGEEEFFSVLSEDQRNDFCPHSDCNLDDRFLVCTVLNIANALADISYEFSGLDERGNETYSPVPRKFLNA